MRLWATATINVLPAVSVNNETRKGEYVQAHHKRAAIGNAMAPGPPNAMLNASDTSMTIRGARRILWLPPRSKVRAAGAVSITGSTSTAVENCSLNHASHVLRRDCSNQGAAITEARLAATEAPAAHAPNTLSTPWGVRMRRCRRRKRDSNCQTGTTTPMLHRLNHSAGPRALAQSRSAPTMANHINTKPATVAWRG